MWVAYRAWALRAVWPLVLIVSLQAPALAQRPEIYQSGRGQSGSELAVGGYDTVAYHTQSDAVLGLPTFRVAWKGAEWRFASLENRDKFVAQPEKYAPQYGGYCAFAVAYGSTAHGDPKLFTIHKGKLYLNLNESVQATWRLDQDKLIKDGDANWPKVLR